MISEIKHWISITFAIQKFLHFTKTTHHLPNLLNLNFNDSSNILKLLQKKKEKIKLTLQEEKLNLSSHLESKIIVFAIQNWREIVPRRLEIVHHFPKPRDIDADGCTRPKTHPRLHMNDRKGGGGGGDRGWRSENGEEPRILLNIQPDTLADWLLIIRPTRITINLAVSRVCSPQTLHLPPPSPSILLQSGADRSWINEKGERALCTRRKSNASRS